MASRAPGFEALNDVMGVPPGLQRVEGKKSRKRREEGGPANTQVSVVLARVQFHQRGITGGPVRVKHVGAPVVLLGADDGRRDDGTVHGARVVAREQDYGGSGRVGRTRSTQQA